MLNNYYKYSELEIGLLINFGNTSLKFNRAMEPKNECQSQNQIKS